MVKRQTNLFANSIGGLTGLPGIRRDQCVAGFPAAGWVLVATSKEKCVAADWWRRLIV
jgi:hypothetical protein